MTRRDTWLLAGLFFLISFLFAYSFLAPGGEHPRPVDMVDPCSSTIEASAQGKLISYVEVEPKELVWNGITIRFGEAWIEKGEEIYAVGGLVPLRGRADYNYLCFRLSVGEDAFLRHEGGFFVMEGAGGSFGESKRFRTDQNQTRFILFNDIFDPTATFPMRASLISNWHDDREDNITFSLKGPK